MSEHLFNNLPPDSPEEDRLIGAFVRQREDDRRRRRYRKLLSREHDLRSPLGPAPLRGERTGGSRSSRRVYWLAAAAITVLAVATFAWLYPSQPSQEELLANYLTVDDYYVPLSRSGSENTQTTIPEDEVALLVDYGAGRFDRVIARMRSGLSPVGRFYVALALITQERDEEASVLLVDLRDNERYGESARWYATLLQLRMGNVAEAKRRLSTYRVSDVRYYQRARKLLRTID